MRSSICLPLLAISIHALRVEGDYRSGTPIACRTISIHALRVEGDNCPRHNSVFPRHISIHALRVEGDACIIIIDTR